MINYDRIYVEIKCIKIEYPDKPYKILGIKCLNVTKFQMYWLKAIVVLRNTM